MNTIKTSIQAIIITLLFFLSIIFISLFKGITLYNINIQNLHIKKIFIKIEQNKLISDINIQSLPQKKEKIDINVIINNLRLLNYIKKLTITAPTFYLKYNNSYLNIKNHNIILKAYIKNIFPDINLIITYFKYQNISLKNIHLNLKQKLADIKLKGFLTFQKSLINFKGKFNVLFNTLNLHINSNNLSLKWKNYLIFFKDFTIKTKINFNNQNIFSKLSIKNASLKDKNISIKNAFNITSKIKTDLKYNNITSLTNIKKIDLIYEKIPISANEINIIQKNKNLKINLKKIFIKNFKEIKNIYILKSNIRTNLFNYQTFINTLKITADYKNYLINSYDTNISIKNKSNILINITKSDINNKNLNLSLYKINLIKKENNISYSINSTNLISKKIKANSSKIEGNTKIILNKIISGIFDGFNFKIKNNKFNIPNKTYTSKQINFNNIIINNLKLDLIKKYAIFNSTAHFNKNIKEVLKKELNISIPITQINGKNKIYGIVTFDKNISFNIKAYSKNPILKLFNLPLQAKEANITITPNFSSFSVNKSYLEITPKINLFFSGIGKIDHKSLILKLNGIIENFVIYPILNVKNFKESATINLTTPDIFLKNSHIYINLKKYYLIVNNLKNILQYTTLNDLINDGLLFITFAKNVQILTYIIPKLPIFYKHNNKPIKNLSNLQINKIMLNIEIIKDKIILYNKFIKFFMKKNDIFLNLKNVDINLFPLENFYYKNLNKKTENQNKKIIIYLKNSNILYKNHKFLSQKAKLQEINNSVTLKSVYKNSSIKGYTKHNYFLLEGKNFKKEELKALLPQINFLKEINLDFTLVKSPDNYYIGDIYINHAIINKLTALNNVVAFLNTIPSILSLSSPGFSAKGYEIKTGNIQYLLYKKILYIKYSKIIGKNIDFISKGYLDFNKNYINLKTTAILKLKLKKIPIIGKGLSYLLLGKDGNIKVNILIRGNLNNPKIKKDIGKAIIPNPFELFKRAITLPFNLF
jgi:hypothetical protein